MNTLKKKILIITGEYLPGVKGGGPIVSIKNLTDTIYDKFDFYIITSDKDYHEKEPYPNIIYHHWNDVGNAKVYYLSDIEKNIFKLSKIIKKSGCEILYLNGIFSWNFTIKSLLLLKCKMIKFKKVIISPRGCFSESCMSVRTFKKKTFINLSKLINLYKNIIWHATSKIEEESIEREISINCNIVIAPNLATPIFNKEFKLRKPFKTVNNIKIIFLSRIHESKNLHGAIELLAKLKGNVEFDIYGPLQDMDYVKKCKELIMKLPNNISVTYKGVIEHDKVIQTFNNYHCLLFPTFGENFGNVILEALQGGCPLVISDKTPWRNLKKLNVGWDIDLNKTDEFVIALQKLINMDNEEYRAYSNAAYNYSRIISSNRDAVKSYLEIFHY